MERNEGSRRRKNEGMKEENTLDQEGRVVERTEKESKREILR